MFVSDVNKFISNIILLGGWGRPPACWSGRSSPPTAAL